MKQYYLVKFRDNKVSEIDIVGLALLTDKDKKYFDSITQNHFPLVHSVGSLYEITYYYLDDFLSRYEWISVSQEQFCFLTNLIGDFDMYFYYPEIDIAY